MNYMVSIYNDTLFTTVAAIFSALAAVVAPTEGAAEAAQRLTKIWQPLRERHTKRKPLLSRFLKNTGLSDIRPMKLAPTDIMTSDATVNNIRVSEMFLNGTSAHYRPFSAINGGYLENK